MSPPDQTRDKFAKGFLVLLAIAISVVFIMMIRRFLMAVLLAGIFSGMTHPLYGRLLRAFKGRRGLAAATTILIVLLVIVVPITGFLGVVTSQAVDVSESVGPWIEQEVSRPDALDRWLQRIPFIERLEPYQDQMAAKAGELTSSVGTFLVNSVAAATKGTVWFLFQLLIMLYAMFFFLIDGGSILNRILYYMPLAPKEEDRMVEKFVSVARATLKGTLVIGILQGGLAGFGFFVAGLGGAAFWGTVMAVLSVIPGVGAALVWVPAVIYLLAAGKLAAAVGLTVWCALVVGTLDNVLRPRLVGKDTKMSDLMILLSTLGGILLFGAVGFIIGPIVAALFVTVWDIYGVAFKEFLPDTSGGSPLSNARSS
ncbi:MAG: permease [Gemmatimonas sp. SG8_17]|nr:MAG: permease [Gemmatimonas sp. SG8_17]